MANTAYMGCPEFELIALDHLDLVFRRFKQDSAVNQLLGATLVLREHWVQWQQTCIPSNHTCSNSVSAAAELAARARTEGLVGGDDLGEVMTRQQNRPPYRRDWHSQHPACQTVL
jgi:hypothetical protein